MSSPLPATPRRAFSWRRFSRPGLLPGGVALGLLALLAYAGITRLNEIGQQTNAIVGKNLEASLQLTELSARTSALDGEIFRAMAQRATGGSGVDVAQATAGVARDIDSFTGDLARYRDRFAGPDDATKISAAIDELRQYREALMTVSAKAPNDVTGALVFMAPYSRQLDTQTARLTAMTNATLRQAEAISLQANDVSRRAGLYFIVLIVVIAASIIVLAWRFGKRQQSMLYSKFMLEAEVAARTAELETARTEAETALAEVRRTQKQLVDAEQMAALGSLVAGVAHEINTPVGTTLTAATLLEDRTRQFRDLVAGNQLKKADLTRYLDTASETTGLMLSNIQRAANLIQSFKQVAVDQTSAGRRVFDLATYIDEVLTSLSPRLRQSAVRVQADCPPGIEMDSYPGALSQVITNFVMNALTHAFDERGKGKITLDASRQDADTIRLDFTDDGSGIPEENLGRIFEPFFTTKRGAGGTGLGLHIVYNIITQQLGGNVNVQSTPGAGTRFTVTLPLRPPATAS